MSDRKLEESFTSLEGCMNEDIEKVMTTEVIHDFKNILTGILGNLALAKDWSNEEDRAYPFIEAAERVTKHANQLALQLLASARGDEQILQDMGVSRVIRNSVELMVSGSGCRNDVKIHPDLRMIVGDETRVAQVLNNLLQNAVQAMPVKGTITVRASNVTVTNESKFNIKPGNYVRISIQDEGTGIPEELLTKIFKMHFTTKKDGSGIGLASCYYIIRNHHGTIHVESDVGKGSIFTILLPAIDKADPEAVVQDVELHTPTGSILVMDDERMVQQTIGDMLNHFGFHVDFASDGKTALESYKRAKERGNPYRAVIMDLTIPGGMGGMEAIKHLVSMDPSVKAIVSSGHTNDPVMQQCDMYGFSASIRKPYNLLELKKVLSDTMN